MALSTAPSTLGSDHFIFCFETSTGVEAAALGAFLSRASTLARRQGARLEVVAFEPGSLKAVVRVLKAAQREALRSPIATAGAVGSVVAAIIAATSVSSGPVRPIAKAGADLVLNVGVDKIDILTHQARITIMDRKKAEQIRAVQKSFPDGGDRLYSEFNEAERLTYLNHLGELTGTIVSLSGELYFQPDGHRGLVYMDMSRARGERYLSPGQYQIKGDIQILGGLQDTIQVHHFKRIQ